jgi:disulfide bond formation protein DsbB
MTLPAAAVLVAALLSVLAGCESGRAAARRTVAIQPATVQTDPQAAMWVASGEEHYVRVCAACHGPAGAGRPGLGKTLADSAFIQGLDDEALLAFIKKGRYPGDPQNTTGRGMPAKGGNPALSEDDLLDIIAYLRTLQDQSVNAANG